MNASRDRRIKRATKIRAIIKKLAMHRLVVHKSNQHIYAQIIDTKSLVLASCSTLIKKDDKSVNFNDDNKIEMAKWVGASIATKAIANGVTRVAFDRSGFKYHGRIKALADAARENGLVF